MNRASLSSNEDKQECDHFRSALASIIHQAIGCRYVYEKPRGYAGDFVTQEMIWFGRTQGGSHRYSGTTETGRLINSLTLDMENCRANEERIYLLRKFLSSVGPRIASIGSGCCIELWDMPQLDSSDRDILLVDQDEGALAHARIQLAPFTSSKITYQQANVLKFALRDPGNLRHTRDFVYAFGLLDYFSLKNAQRIVHGLWRYVAPGGALVVTNSHPSNPTRLWMEYGCDWFLEYKNEQEMQALADGLKDVRGRSLTLDSYGVYQYLRIDA